nr:putative ribonuclease H-like domain-containing protein [Tanacetum cinerariifolium]
METKMPNFRPCFPQHKCINDSLKGNPQHALKDKGVIDSGCSRHMTGNMSYLSDFKELNGGYVAFGGNPKGGSGPTWLFDIDTLTKTMNYQPVTTDNQSNPSAGVQEQFDAEKVGEENVQQYVLFPIWSSEFEDFFDNSINEDNAAGSLVPVVGQLSPTSTNTFSAAGPSNAAASPTHGKSSSTQTRSMTRVAKDQGGLSHINNDDFHTCMFACFLSQEEPKREEGINYEEVFAPVARIEAISLFLAYDSFMGFIVYQMDVKSTFLYGTIKEEVYICQPLGFEDPDYPDKVYKVVKELYGLHQVPRACAKSKQLWPLHPLRLNRTVSGKDSSNPLMADNLPKIVWYSTHHVALMKSWLVQKQMALGKMATGKEISNPFMAGVNTPRSDEDRLELIELMVFLLPSDEKVGIRVSAVDLQVSAVRHILLL